MKPSNDLREQDNALKAWLASNSWNLMVTFVTIVIAFTYLKYEVADNTKRIQAVDARVSLYPSKDYFELKFKTIDEKQATIETGIKDLTNKVQNHVEETR